MEKSQRLLSYRKLRAGFRDVWMEQLPRIALTQFDFVQKKMPPEESSYNGR